MNSRVYSRKLLAMYWEQKILTHMQKIHKTEMVGYIFQKGGPVCGTFNLLQVLTGKRMVKRSK